MSHGQALSVYAGISIQSENFVTEIIWDFINYQNGWNKILKT